MNIIWKGSPIIVVMFYMLSLVGKKFQVFYTIVVMPAVYMMYNLLLIKQSTNMPFHYQPMLKNIATRISVRVFSRFYVYVATLVFSFATIPRRVIAARLSAIGIRRIYKHIFRVALLTSLNIAPRNLIATIRASWLRLYSSPSNRPTVARSTKPTLRAKLQSVATFNTVLHNHNQGHII